MRTLHINGRCLVRRTRIIRKKEKKMKKNLRFEMRIAEDTLEHLQAIKADYENKLNKKISLAKAIEYTIDMRFIDIKREEK